MDTVQADTISQMRKYTWLGAKVVGSTVNTQLNFITIHRGLLQEVRPNMGVVSPQGIVGTVVNVSDNYASVMTLLHRQYKVVVKIKNGGERGTIEWDGISPMFVTLKDIPKSAKVQVGDSIVTSPTSSLFPGNLMVGTIAEIVDDKSSNFYTLKVKPATNFFNIEYVYVIANAQLVRTKATGGFHAKKIPMSELLKNIFRFVLFIFVQVFILFQDAAPAQVYHTILILSIYIVAAL